MTKLQKLWAILFLAAKLLNRTIHFLHDVLIPKNISVKGVTTRAGLPYLYALI